MTHIQNWNLLEYLSVRTKKLENAKLEWSNLLLLHLFMSIDGSQLKLPIFFTEDSVESKVNFVKGLLLLRPIKRIDPVHICMDCSPHGLVHLNSCLNGPEITWSKSGPLWTGLVRRLVHFFFFFNT